jgi:threonine dehydrogenase-like Zn-dependent dehydrogenase
MRALVFHAVGDIRLDDVPDPRLQEPTDAIVRLTSSAICGTDLHFVRGTMAGMKEGTILGHEGVGWSSSSATTSATSMSATAS